MANSAKTKTLRVRGQVFSWEVHRQPQWCTTDGWRGLAVLVELADEPQRSLIVQFPMEFASRRSTPQRQRPSVAPKELAEHVAAALDAGWEPSSRGKPFLFEVIREAMGTTPNQLK